VRFKIEAWKRLLSYFFPVKLYGFIGYGDVPVKVLLWRGEVCLETPRALYSWGRNYEPFRELVKRRGRDILNPPPGKILVLGGGLMSVSLIFSEFLIRNNRPVSEFYAVEIDDKVIDIAREVLPAFILKNIQFIHVDAFDFVLDAPQDWDMIIVDIFVDDVIPHRFLNKAFIQILHRIMKVGGLLIYNMLGRNQKERQEAIRVGDALVDNSHFQKQFFFTSNNVLIIARKI